MPSTVVSDLGDRCSLLKAWLRSWASDGGQTTAEYALVLVAAATIATLVIAWATNTNRIASLLDTVFRNVTGLVS